MKVTAILLASAMIFTLAACGSSDTNESTASESTSAAETEKPSDSESAEPAETEDKENLAPDGVWETDGERVTIEDETVTIDYIDENGEVTETYWVGSFELDEDSDTWTSTRDPDAKMTAECDTIEFTWEGTDNIYDTLSYAVNNEDGTQTTVRLQRTESLGEVAEGVVPDFTGSEDETSETSAAKTSTSTSSSAAAADASTSTNESAGDTTAASSGESNSPAAEKASSGGTSETTSNKTSSGNGTSSSSKSTGNTGTASSGTGSTASSGTTATACSHNYQSSVKTAATCSSTGTMKYTCTKCGDSYETTIPATGNHNWQAIYKTVHHDATGHYETVTVQDAVYEKRNVCNRCGYVATSKGEAGVEELGVHIRAEHPEGASYSLNSVCVQTAITEQQWVVDTAAYDEQVVDYYRCANCGATK